MSRFQRMRLRAGATLVDSFFRGISAAGRLHPLSRPERHGVRVIANVPYREGGHPDHRLDIYMPSDVEGPLPVVLYIHGGGFRILSKDTHWLLALAFARRGFVVFNISYRLAPRDPFPAAIEDACAAYEFVVRNAPKYGGDLSRFVVAGESAGANLATAVTVAACWRREEPYARAVFDTGVVPRAVMPACGILQVSDTARFQRRKKLPVFLSDRLTEVESAYLTGYRKRVGFVDGEGARPTELDLADPLCFIERGVAPDRPLPPFFAPVGTADPILDDTRRLATALGKLGVECEARYYPGKVHAFHAMIVRKAARDCWSHGFAFLKRHLGEQSIRKPSRAAR